MKQRHKKDVVKGVITLLLMFCLGVALAAPPESDKKARDAVREIQQGIHKGNQTFYCECPINWITEIVDLKSCGYEKPESHRSQLEKWDTEHVVPASKLGQHLPCWEKAPPGKSREYCRKVNTEFKSMYFNLHNLVPTIRQVNRNRLNYPFTVFDGNSGCKKEALNHGECGIKISKECKKVEPPESTRGAIARIYLYMWEESKGKKSKFKLDKEQRDMFNGWNESYPVTKWECERDRLIAQPEYHGKPNPKVQKKCSEEGL